MTGLGLLLASPLGVGLALEWGLLSLGSGHPRGTCLAGGGQGEGTGPGEGDLALESRL